MSFDLYAPGTSLQSFKFDQINIYTNYNVVTESNLIILFNLSFEVLKIWHIGVQHLEWVFLTTWGNFTSAATAKMVNGCLMYLHISSRQHSNGPEGICENCSWLFEKKSL